MALYEILTSGTCLIGLCVVMGFVLGMKSLPEYADDQQCLTQAETKSLNCGAQTEVLLHFFKKNTNESFERIDRDVQQRFDRRRITLKYYVKNRYWQMKPAARFTGESELSDENPNSSMVPIVNWKTGHKLHHWGGFQRYGICYKYGRIAVPVSGVYYLYSHLDLYHPSIHYIDEKVPLPKNETFKQSLFKYSYENGQETELLTALTPHKSSGNGHFNRYTSYVSGLVNLTAGEEISLKGLEGIASAISWRNGGSLTDSRFAPVPELSHFVTGIGQYATIRKPVWVEGRSSNLRCVRMAAPIPSGLYYVHIEIVKLKVGKQSAYGLYMYRVIQN